MSEKFNLEIISPEKILLKDEIVSATIPSFEGEMTILSNHLPLITFLYGLSIYPNLFTLEKVAKLLIKPIFGPSGVSIGQILP